MARSTSASPGATINGSYKFTNIVAVPFTISESDDLSIRFGSSVSLLGMAGGGFDLASWTRSGIRVDARVFLGMDKIETVLDAQGTPHEATPTGANFTFTSPAIQWSNDQTGIGRSSLSGTVTGYTTLTGTHFQAPVLVTVGYFFRF
jgi:hypothetical protein